MCERTNLTTVLMTLCLGGRRRVHIIHPDNTLKIRSQLLGHQALTLLLGKGCRGGTDWHGLLGCDQLFTEVHQLRRQGVEQFADLLRGQLWSTAHVAFDQLLSHLAGLGCCSIQPQPLQQCRTNCHNLYTTNVLCLRTRVPTVCTFHWLNGVAASRAMREHKLPCSVSKAATGRSDKWRSSTGCLRVE